ncbi:MAG: hypothetical protein WCI05_11315 [Myxococcales bacterium]|jgi:hypothetical protein
MKLPPAIARTRLFRRGVILRTTMVLTVETKTKFLIVVSSSDTVDPIFAVITTSKLKWFEKHPSDGIAQKP